MDWESKEFKTPESAIAAIKALGYNVRSEAEEKSFLTAHVEDSIKKNTREIYDMIDGKIKESAGVEKNANEKTTDYFARAFKDTTSKLQSLEKDNKKLQEDAGKGNEAVSQVQKQFDAFKDLHKKTVGELESKVEEFKSNQFKSRVNTEVQSAISKFRMNMKKIDDNVLEHTIKSLVSEFNSEVQPIDQNGVIVFNDKDGKPLISQQDGSMLTTEKILESKFAFLFDKERKQDGTGAGANGEDTGTNTSAPQAGENKYKLQIPETVKSRSGLMTFLEKEQKIQKGPDFDRYYAANVNKDWGLRD